MLVVCTNKKCDLEKCGFRKPHDAWVLKNKNEILNSPNKVPVIIEDEIPCCHTKTKKNIIF